MNMGTKQWTLQGVDFACDENKQRINKQKHGIDLLDASSAFFDPRGIPLFDIEHSSTEDRFCFLGLSKTGILFYVVYTTRNGVVRLISARKATKTEAKRYEQQY